MLGLKDNIKYGDKLWVNYYKLGEEIGCKEGVCLGVYECLFIAVSESDIIFPEV